MFSASIRSVKLITTLLSLFFLMALSGNIQAETKPRIAGIGMEQPKTFLFVGNSFMYYNNSMHNYFLRIARAADPKNRKAYRATSVTISGSGLNWHDVESYFRPGGVASYSFVGDNEVVFNKFDKPFDVVIMQDCSQCPVHPQLKSVFHEYAAKDSRIILKHGAKPVLLMTWAYEDKPEMTAGLAEEYTKAGNDNDMLVIPAGLAFARARSQKPGIGLYQKDKRHPTLSGTYLSALTIYAAIYRQSPVGSPVPAGLDAETAKFLQTVAWETVREYYGK
ncbi:MAG TPA: hypothetical protein VLT92_09010 [Burkholderiales bacterium]|nr:hypothetical protein [Burkholderiales bacterium]